MNEAGIAPLNRLYPTSNHHRCGAVANSAGTEPLSCRTKMRQRARVAGRLLSVSIAGKGMRNY